jgi:hypothetical protein
MMKVRPHLSCSSRRSMAMLLKLQIPVPIPTAEVDAVSRRARSRWIEQDSGTVAAQSSAESLRARSPSPTEGTVYAGGAAASAIGNNSPAEQSRIVAGVNDDHRTSCNACGMGIKGTRYECVNCPTLPASYNLVSKLAIHTYLRMLMRSAPRAKCALFACMTPYTPSSASIDLYPTSSAPYRRPSLSCPSF